MISLIDRFNIHYSKKISSKFNDVISKKDMVILEINHRIWDVGVFFVHSRASRGLLLKVPSKLCKMTWRSFMKLISSIII